MNLSQTQKRQIGAILIIFILIAIYGSRRDWMPIPDNTTYHDVDFSFTYPRVFHVDEYGVDVASVGKPFGDTYTPLVEVVRYENDPDEKLPATYLDFIKKQALNLCGTDGSVESITCTAADVKPYVSKKGLQGQELSLTLVRKNLKTATTTSSQYGPFYVFNITPQPAKGETFRFRSLFIYPSIDAFVAGTSSPELLQNVVDTFLIPTGVSKIGE
ncbi:MAG: hypothetical protein JWN49_69 [Parcubacteria group bacterium]|nr:hypothetical protein [Parcubacteria group bacterium]